MKSIITTTNDLYNTEELVITKRKIVTKKPNFQMIGNGTMNMSKIKSINMISEMYKATAAGEYVLHTITTLVDYHCEDGIVRVPMVGLTNSEVVTWKKGFKELKAKGLIVRTKKSHYLLNPNMLIPKDYQTSVITWNKVADEEFIIRL